ncbi:BRO1-like domain-containing protein [Pyronema domesticum]|nr:BRO1-like domain-containing protein [Pyronema domesticum]
MRGAGKDSAAGRDLLYRYYGQLELLDLRFPVEERGVRVSFTWYDAFTHKSTSQYSLAFEKASIIFNISAVHSCHAANQNRSEEFGVKTAFHSFQAAAGMFTYINENFLHAPSTDLSRDTVKTLININLAQAQEVFLEKQIADGKKSGMLAKLAAQAALLYSQAVEGLTGDSTKGVFDKTWATMCSSKQYLMESLAHYLQALADSDHQNYGLSIARLQLAEALAKESVRMAQAIPTNPSANSNLSAESGPALVQITRRHHGLTIEKLNELVKDNDYIYHQAIPSESAIPHIPKMPAAKAIPVQELYQGQDITGIIGPDIFQKIVPMSVTESASLYDEEKAKLVRAEAEKVDIANAEMVAALDYLKLPHSLKLLKNGFADGIDVADEFREWCSEMASRPEGMDVVFTGLKTSKRKIKEILEASSKSLDQEELVCEKMRGKYQDEWTQQPSSRLTQTLRADIRSYQEAIAAAVASDNQLWTQYKVMVPDMKDMVIAGQNDIELERLWNSRASAVHIENANGRGGETLLDVDDGEGGPTVMEQIEHVEDLLKKLNLIKRERAQVLKDLKDIVHNDDISNMLILNKKAIQNHENQLFMNELEKFRPHQNRLLQATHKQSALMKELTTAYGDLLQDKRIRAEQSRYEALSRQRSSIISKFKKSYQAFLDIWDGLEKAQQFYSEMTETAESLEKNVETFVSNRKSEGAMLLSSIEKEKGTEAERQQRRLREMMERVTITGGQGTVSPSSNHRPPHSQHTSPGAMSPPTTPRYPNQYPDYGAPTPPPPPPPAQQPIGASYYQGYAPPPNGQNQYVRRDSYPQVPGLPQYQAPAMMRRDSNQPLPSPGMAPNSQQYQPNHYSSCPPPQYGAQTPGGYQQHHQTQPYNPGAYIPPPPPPGPPPIQQHPAHAPHNSQQQPQQLQNRGSVGQLPQTAYRPRDSYGQPPPAPTQNKGDPWEGLAGWK